MTIDVSLLKQDLTRDEGTRLKPYEDCVGKLTIGVGRNLHDVGISQSEADLMLTNDIANVILALDRAFPWWMAMSEPRQRALANMCFNMGFSKLLGFRQMLAALQAGSYQEASEHALDSEWARQVGARANRIAALIA